MFNSYIEACAGWFKTCVGETKIPSGIVSILIIPKCQCPYDSHSLKAMTKSPVVKSSKSLSLDGGDQNFLSE